MGGNRAQSAVFVGAFVPAAVKFDNGLEHRKCRLRSSEEVSLNLVAAFQTKSFKLFMGLHAFGGGGHAQALCETRDCFDDRQGLLARQVVYERAINFDLMEWKSAQVAQA